MLLQKHPTSYFSKRCVLFFQGRLISRTHQIFQEKKNVPTHKRRAQNYTRTYAIFQEEQNPIGITFQFPGKLSHNCAETRTIF